MGVYVTVCVFATENEMRESEERGCLYRGKIGFFFRCLVIIVFYME